MSYFPPTDAGMVDVTQFLKLLDPLLVLVTQTTPVIDGAAKGSFVCFYSLCFYWMKVMTLYPCI